MTNNIDTLNTPIDYDNLHFAHVLISYDTVFFQYLPHSHSQIVFVFRQALLSHIFRRRNLDTFY